MINLSPGIIFLVVTVVLIFLGLAERVLDRLYLTDLQAVLFLILMYVGYLMPPINLTANTAVNIGGGLLPLLLVVYVLYRADTNKERLRALTTAIVVAGIIYYSERTLPVEPGFMTFDIDPIYVSGITAGLGGYVIGGRSRRSVFIGAVLGVIIADLGNVFWLYQRGITEQTITFGGAGLFDVVLISGVTAVVLAEVIGEIRERLAN